MLNTLQSKIKTPLKAARFLPLSMMVMIGLSHCSASFAGQEIEKLQTPQLIASAAPSPAAANAIPAGSEAAAAAARNETSNPIVENKDPQIRWLPRKLGMLQEGFAKITCGVELTGFFDTTLANRGSNPNYVDAGDFEFDFAREFGRNFQAAGALVYNPHNGTELTVGFVDYHFFGGRIAPRGRIFVEKGFHIQAGRFDIPFGSDWQYFASKDRLTVTPPLTTDLVMDGGYNDTGVRMLGNTASMNYTLYVLRGLEKARAYGGRIGFTPFSNPYSLNTQEAPAFELGTSYLYDAGIGGAAQLKAVNFDLALRLGRLNLQGEWVHKEDVNVEDSGEKALQSGFHLTQSLDIERLLGRPASVYFRYEHFGRRSPAGSVLEEGEESIPSPAKTGLNRITGGVQWALSDLFLLKLDYLQFIRTSADTLESEELGRRAFYAQLVFKF